MLKLPKNCGNCICMNDHACRMLNINIDDPDTRPDRCHFNEMENIDKDDPLICGLTALCLVSGIKNGFCKE